MRIMKLGAAMSMAFTLIACATVAPQTAIEQADDTASVQTFYDLLSNPGSDEYTQAFLGASSADWSSIGDYSGKNKSRDAFLGQVAGFGKLMPDLEWSVQSMHQEGNQVTVRSRATGTPQGPLFGVDGQGRSFDILTIDIHQIENGLITSTYHVEDWAGALQQLSDPAAAQAEKDESQASLDTVMAFMGAMGSGDMAQIDALMADNMVWLNEGDKAMPWIGPWTGKAEIMDFLGVFSANVQTTKWENTDVFASGDTVAVFGEMNFITTKSGEETGDFHFGLRAKVRDGQVVLWNWFENSYAVSNAYHGK